MKSDYDPTTPWLRRGGARAFIDLTTYVHTYDIIVTLHNCTIHMYRAELLSQPSERSGEMWCCGW